MATTMSATLPTSRARARRFAVPSRPWRAAAEGAAWGGLLAAVITNALVALPQHLTPWPLVDLLFNGLLAFLFIFAFEGIAALVWKLARIVLRILHAERPLPWFGSTPSTVVGRLVGALFYAFARVLFPDSVFSVASATAADAMIIVVAMLSGALLGVTWRGAQTSRSRWGWSALALVPLFLVAAWLAWPGSDEGLVQPLPPAPVAPLTVENPGLPGTFAAQALTYGSGNDRARAEYREGVTLTTAPVDGTPIFAGPGGIGLAHLRWRWGFDFSALPLGGRVWYPAGDGLFPLVLIVHGNHSPLEFSDPGYAYLGEHLASRGFIVASVDENFLNGALLDDYGRQEMPLRAWLLLKHLEEWRAWNSDATNPFFGKVDLERIALIGHSRGGEAVAHAANMNRHQYPPISRVSERADLGFGIRALVSIAPSDGFYQPQGSLLALRDVSYLTLAGAHDADASIFWGLSQYNRTTFTGEAPEAFKAAAYLYRANHGQFNSVWRYGDRGRYDWLMLNRAALLTEEEQQAAAKTLITGFLEAALHDRAAYRALFYQPDAARAWLPEDAIVTQYQDARFIPLDTNNQRGMRDVMDVQEGRVRGEALSIWETETLFLRDGETSQNTRALHAGWDAETDPAISFAWPVEESAAWNLTPEDALSFTLGSTRDDYTPEDVIIVLEAVDGTQATLPLSRFVTIQPPLVPRPLKSDAIGWLFGLRFERAWQAERVPQTADIPLATFVEAAPDLQLEQLSGLRIEFDGTEAGEVFLDEVGIRRGARQ